MIDKLGDTITGLHTRINKTLLQDAKRRWLSDSQNELREFYKTDVIPMSRSLYKNLKEIKEELIEEVQEMLNIFESMEQKVDEKPPTKVLLQNEIDRLLEVSMTSEIRDCVLLSAAQQKHELLKDELEKSSNLLMTISELKSKLQTIEKGKNVNTKFDSSETLGKRVCVTPFNKNIADKAMNASNTNVNSDRSKQVTSQSTPKLEQGQKHNENVITRGMYKINKQDMKTPDYKANTNVSNSTGVGSSHSVRRSTSKDNKSKNSILKNTKSSSTYVWKTLNSDCLDSNKYDTNNYGVTCEDEAKRRNSGTKTKTFEENCYLLLYVISNKEDTAYQRQLITRIRVMINSLYGVSLFTYTSWCMTRSSTTELLLPFENPKRVLRSRRKIFETPSLAESNSSEFDQISEIEEHIEEEEGKFLKELRNNTFSGLEHEDANEHIEKVLEIADLFHIPKVTQDQIMLRAFPVSLTGAASRTGSIETSDGLAVIQAQLNNLRREIKKVNEKVYAAQVGCELCKGPHYTKDCPQKEEGKTLEEAYYMQFGAPRGQYRAAGPGFYQRNNGNSSYPT
ncbi:retrovirus-related pol polyprotein from transposon TNT 1-94 [Tanacetum coccineum]|uniref:Retrovirus-related pol polyprotein from transposon TNT 1-94 n=1 Tax=Tanacetum coccineum TaxID=301880 RepID=A0ABQ4ZBA8_9ASTR